MMNFKKRMALAVLFCLLFCSVACTGKTPGAKGTEPESGANTEAPAPEEDIWLFRNGETRFCVIYPADPADAVFRAARNLQTAFQTYGNTRIEIYEEGTDVPVNPESAGFEILLGATGRKASSEVIATMEDPGGYAVARSGNQLVIYAPAGTLMESAAEYFIRVYLKTPAQKEADKKLSALALSAVEPYCHVRSGILLSAQIGGVELEDFRIVVPREGYAERYAAELFSDYLFAYYGGKTPTVVTDATKEREHEILIGNTNRTTVQAEEGGWKIEVTGNGIQAVSAHVTGYVEVYDAFRKAIPSSSSRAELKEGDTWSGSISNYRGVQSADITVMYHNVLGYVDKYPAANRPDMMLQIYLAYAPDIIGMQECGQSFFRSQAATLMNGLKNAGYAEIVFTSKGGTGNPIFYQTAKLTLIASGYEHARSGDKGTTWAVFAEKANPERVFAVTNSHFAANSNAGGDATRGNTYRVEDAKKLLEVVEQIKADYPEIPIINGGDFNSSAGSDPGRTLRDGGLTHATAFSTVSPDYSAWIGYPTYDAEKGYYLPRNFVWANIGGALDHIMFGGNLKAISSPEYAILKDRLSCVVSDHLPQLIYVNWNN